jgi:ribosomal protein S18 acetylase RimI-like enzyme
VAAAVAASIRGDERLSTCRRIRLTNCNGCVILETLVPLPMPTISPVAEHECDALAALMRDTIEPLSFYNERARRAELARYTADGLRALVAADPQSVLVARDGDGLVGFCVSRFDDGTIWLSWFGTAAHARGRGIGAALLAALADTLPSRQAHKIWCDSRVENSASRSVLERFGFRRIATLTNHWYGQDYYLWEWYPE